MTVLLHVLLIEDSEDDALLLRVELEQGGFAPEMVRVDTEAALRAALARGGWDVVISDLRLPHFDGMRAPAITAEADPDLAVFIISGKAGEETAVEAMRAGAVDYLLKGHLTRLAPAILRELRETGVRRERRAAEAARARLLREVVAGRAELEAIVNSMTEGLIILDMQGTVLRMNPAAERITGITRDALLGKPLRDVQTIYELRYPDSRPMPVEEWPVSRVLRGETITNYVVDLCRRDVGICQIMSYNGTQVRDDTGTPSYAMLTIRDVTELVATERALAQALERTQQYLDVAGVMLVALDRHGRVTLINRKGLEILGCHADEAIGLNWFEHFIPPEQRDEIGSAFRQLMAGELESVEYHENCVIAKDGEERLLAFHNAVLRDEQDQIIGTISSGEDITERRCAEDQLRESEARFRSLFEDNRAVMLLINPETGSIIDANHAASAYYGYPRDVLRRMMIGEINTLPNEELFTEMARARAEERRHFLFRHRLASGEVRDVEVYAGPLAVSGKTLLYSIVFDVTDRRRAEERLRMFQRAVEQSPATIVITDTQARIIYANPKLTEISGYTFEELRGNTPNVFKSGITPPEEYTRLWKTITAGGEWRGLFCNRKKDGELYWEAASVSPIRDAEGKTTHYLAVKEDITAQRHAEEERERLLSELDATIEAIPDGYIVYAPDGSVRRMNEIAEQLLGLAEDERQLPYAERMARLRLERPDGQLFPLEELPSYRALRGETVRGVVMVVHQSDQTYWLSVSASPILTHDGAMLGAVMEFTDFTQLHELQEQREIYIHTISHDLRAPLTLIQGHGQLLRDNIREEHDGGELLESTEAILRAARRMNVMIQDLVDVARLEGGQLVLHRQAVELSGYVAEMLRRHAAVLEITRIHMAIPADLPPVWADADRLERIVTNLLSNALKYSTPGTPIEITARRKDNMVLVSVTNHGPGITPEELPRLFERFYRAPGGRKAEGVGLGLYITRMLVDAHGGTVRAESVPDGETTFTFTLPIAPER